MASSAFSELTPLIRARRVDTIVFTHTSKPQRFYSRILAITITLDPDRPAPIKWKMASEYNSLFGEKRICSFRSTARSVPDLQRKLYDTIRDSMLEANFFPYSVFSALAFHRGRFVCSRDGISLQQAFHFAASFERYPVEPLTFWQGASEELRFLVTRSWFKINEQK